MGVIGTMPLAQELPDAATIPLWFSASHSTGEVGDMNVGARSPCRRAG